MLLNSLENDEDTEFIQLDQSNAYDVVNHHLLIEEEKTYFRVQYQNHQHTTKLPHG